MKKQIKELKQQTIDATEIIGESNQINQLKATIAKVAPTNSRVTIVGQSGAGKSMVAKEIHKQSQRANEPFVVVNAARMTEEQTKKRMFGEEGSQAGEDKVGAIEEAHNGTLLIEEVGEMSKDVQSKLLGFLAEQKFERVGGAKSVEADVRVLSSTSVDLETRVEAGLFREDLLHRLAVIPIKVPSLSERSEDIPMLVSEFLVQIEKQTGIKKCKINEDAMSVLQAQKWPGNVRQLKNNVERLMILNQNEDQPVTAANMPSEITNMLPSPSKDEIMSLPLRDARLIFERDYLEAQLLRFGGNIARTASFVGMERTALHRKIKTLGIGEGI